MKKLFFVLAALMTVPALYAAEDTPIQNVCDSLSLGETPVIELVPAYIDESNWYGNPQTNPWTKDSSSVVRHETYETVKVSISTKKTMQLPVSIPASCRELPGQEVKYAKWTTSKTWEPYTEDDVETRIYTMRELSMNGHDETNTSNILAFVPGGIPQDYAFKSNQLLFSVTFEFAFEYWFASVSYKHKTESGATTYYVTSGGNDSLSVVNSAFGGLSLPDTTKSIHIQTLKVVLVDSRKLPQPESSSSVVVSSSSEEKSSSSETPVISSSVEQSSSSEAPTSSADVESSSSAKPETSSSTGPVLSSSSNVPESSSAQESSSSDKPATSSSGEQEVSSSSAKPESSSSEKTTRLVTAPNLDGSARMVQVRTLDGSIVKNSGNLAPGVYYVKYSNGKWSKMAVLPR